MDNFDLRKYLVENKVTTNSRMMNEAEEVTSQQAVAVAKKVADKVDDMPEFDKVVDAIVKDPKAQAELIKLMGLNEGEGLTEDIVDKLALHFGKKAEQNPEQLDEEEGFDYGGAFWTGLLGGGVLAKYLASMGDVITPHMQMMGHSPSHIGAMMAGSIGGAILGVIGKAVYNKVKGK
jgi:hypothetical protein